MKMIISLVFGVAVAGATMGCNDDSSDTPANVSCNMAGTLGCLTGPGTAADCTGQQGTVVDSCPSGALLTCTITQNGQTGTWYVYDQTTVDGMKTMNPTDPCALVGG